MSVSKYASKDECRARFAKLASEPDERLPLDEAALLIAAESGETFDVAQYLQRLDALAGDFNSDGRFNTDLGIPVAGLIAYIHSDLAFSGNVSDYYDPSNSYLNRVIDYKSGIPISLALIHMAIGTRLGIAVEGISFPGHFLVRYGGVNGSIVDPFSGRELSRADCQTLLRQMAGSRATLQDEYFNVATPREILIRMLDNLKQIFWRKKSWDESKDCIDRQILLFPEREEFNIQLGAVYEMQGNHLLAEQQYTRVLQQATDDALKDMASKRLLAMDTSKKTVH